MPGVDGNPALPHPGGRLSGLFARVKAILLRPTAEWQAIASEPTTASDIYLGYVMPLGAIGVIAAFVGSALIGVQDGTYTVRTGIVPSAVAAVVHLALIVVGVHLIARFVNRTARVLDAQRDSLNALRVVAYSLTPAFLAAGLIVVRRWSEVAIVLGLYGVYLLYVGLRVLMRCKPGDALGYAAIVSVMTLVVSVVFVALAGFITGLVGQGAGTIGYGAGTASRIAGATGAIVGQIVTGGTADDRARARDALFSLPGLVVDAVTSKDTKGDQGVLEKGASALAKIAAGGKEIEPLDFLVLAKLLPPAVGEFKLTGFDGGPDAFEGLQGSVVRARYESNEAKMSLEIGDMGQGAGIGRVIAWFDPALDKTSDWGYKRSYRLHGNYVREEYDRRDRSGLVGMMVADRFAISARGTGVAAEQLKATVDAIDIAKLAALAK